MKHVYLSERLIEEAVKNRSITTTEADKLKSKMNSQPSIFKLINK